MPFVRARPYGQETVELSPLNGSGTYVISAQDWEYKLTAELHAGYDLMAITDRLSLQLFALVELGLPSIASARIGVGLTF
jgi:hypothetical protein